MGGLDPVRRGRVLAAVASYYSSARAEEGRNIATPQKKQNNQVVVGTIPTEHEEQRALCRYLRQKGLAYYAIPNAGRRSLGAASWARAEGLRAGVPDLCVLPPRSDGGPIWIELKRQSGGRTSPAQAEWIERLKGLGYRARVCAGAADAVTWLEGELAAAAERRPAGASAAEIRAAGRDQALADARRKIAAIDALPGEPARSILDRAVWAIDELRGVV